MGKLSSSGRSSSGINRRHLNCLAGIKVCSARTHRATRRTFPLFASRPKRREFVAIDPHAISRARSVSRPRRRSALALFRQASRADARRHEELRHAVTERDSIVRAAAPRCRAVSVRSTFEAQVTRHSEKPDAFYRLVEKLYVNRVAACRVAVAVSFPKYGREPLSSHLIARVNRSSLGPVQTRCGSAGKRNARNV